MQSIAFVTPTFTPDLGRCEILVDSIRNFAPNINHYLIIDRYELKNFAHLAGPRTILVPSEEVMHNSFHRLPGRKGIWLNVRTLPLRGWMAQQFRKLGAVNIAHEDVLVCIDSDMAFVRPFEPGQIMEGDKAGLLDVSYVDAMVQKWTEIGADILGLSAKECIPRGHVGQMIVWSRKHLIDMLSHIERCHNNHWQITIGRKSTFSEYILYGIYIRCVLGYENSQHVPSTRPLVKQPWGHDFSSIEARWSYIHDIDPGNIAVMIHSKFGISARDLRPHFEAAWKDVSGPIFFQKPNLENVAMETVKGNVISG